MADTSPEHYAHDSDVHHNLLLEQHRIVNGRGGRTRGTARGINLQALELQGTSLTALSNTAHLSMSADTSAGLICGQELSNADDSIMIDAHNMVSPDGLAQSAVQSDLLNTIDNDSDTELSEMSEGDFSDISHAGTSTSSPRSPFASAPTTANLNTQTVVVSEGHVLRPRHTNRVVSPIIKKNRPANGAMTMKLESTKPRDEASQSVKESIIGGRSLRHRPAAAAIPTKPNTKLRKPNSSQSKAKPANPDATTTTLLDTSLSLMDSTTERPHDVMDIDVPARVSEPDKMVAADSQETIDAVEKPKESIENAMQSTISSMPTNVVEYVHTVPGLIARVVDRTDKLNSDATIAISGITPQWLDKHHEQFVSSQRPSRSLQYHSSRPVRNVGKPKRLMDEFFGPNNSQANDDDYDNDADTDIGNGSIKRQRLSTSFDTSTGPVTKRRVTQSSSPSAASGASAEFILQENAEVVSPGQGDTNNLPVLPSPDAARSKPSTKSKPAAKPRAKNQPTAGQQKTKQAAEERRLPAMNQGKPPSCASPPVWATFRQQLCQALPYYRAYQSGQYSSNKITVGHLIDGAMELRDFVSDDVVLTSVGGGRTKLKSGVMGYEKDHLDPGHRLYGFQTCLATSSPVALVIGRSNTLVGTRVPHDYNLMGWFHVTDLFVELTADNFKVWKVRLEKIDLTSKSWWARPDTPEPGPVKYDAYQPVKQSCPKCHVESAITYTDGWTCMNFNCSNFFQFANGAASKDLMYNEYFYHKRTQYSGPPPQPLVPALPSIEEYKSKGLTGFEDDCTKGIVCPLCKGCSRRVSWYGFYCENGCDFKLSIPLKVLTLFDALQQGDAAAGTQMHESFIGYQRKDIRPYIVHEYTIPGLDAAGTPIGVVQHFKANQLINKQMYGPNEMFQDMQTQDFDLSRKPARQAGYKGEVLTDHFAKNWGAPYKYGVAVASTAFTGAPDVILQANARLSWAGKETVGNGFTPFNELLSIGYMAEGHIGYHDDGEDTLGETVASLSLGCSATMMFRLKKAHKSQFTIGKINSIKTKNVPPCLKLHLEHGDIVVMHGYGIQRFYEHMVIPHGKLRFALTGRYIIPGKMESTVDRDLAAACGTLPERAKDFAYDGDINTVDGNTRFDLAESKAQLMQSLQATINASKAVGICSPEEIDAFLRGQLAGASQLPHMGSVNGHQSSQDNMSFSLTSSSQNNIVSDSREAHMDIDEQSAPEAAKHDLLCNVPGVQDGRQDIDSSNDSNVDLLELQSGIELSFQGEHMDVIDQSTSDISQHVPLNHAPSSQRTHPEADFSSRSTIDPLQSQNDTISGLPDEHMQVDGQGASDANQHASISGTPNMQDVHSGINFSDNLNIDPHLFLGLSFQEQQ